ncbi:MULTISPECIES: hypothetical protein [Bacteroidales]|uniref:Lipocalin-like domain-containing protein n=1 Tax=Phocaeicola barnesiae TaxID=376804 RepID=A0AAW5NAN8_9BACT|nr:hypothetical protein [Phocaeicola barnesiae]MCR8875269.1 hypothetical protein [Phocaeicola barnesiae]
MKQMKFSFIMLALLLVCSCGNKQQSVSIDNLIVGKWKIVEYGGGYVNALDTLDFYKNGKADCPPETGEFTYRLVKSDSLIVCNKGIGEQHFKILKLSNDSLIKQIRRQRIYADSIDELVNGEIEKYIRVTNE